jgi:hypothetical protein
VDESKTRSKRDNLRNLTYLLFGGSFLGIVVIAASFQFEGWIGKLIWFLGFCFLSMALDTDRRRNRIRRDSLVFLITIVVLIIGIAGAAVGQLAGRGLADLAASGIHGSDKSSVRYIYAEYYLVIIILWLLLGVPHRAFKYELDRNGEGNARHVILKILITTASVLTGIYILVLHFMGGPLRVVGIGVLIPGIIFTIFLVAPIYNALSKACWQRGIRGLFSPKPLTEHWGEALTELDIAFHNAGLRLLERVEQAGIWKPPNVKNDSDPHGHSAGQRPADDRNPHLQQNSDGSVKNNEEKADVIQKSTSGQKSNNSAMRPSRNPKKRKGPPRNRPQR